MLPSGLTRQPEAPVLLATCNNGLMQPMTSPQEIIEMSKRYTVGDGTLMLTLEEAEEGGYIVTSPVDPELITEADTICGGVCQCTRCRQGAPTVACETAAQVGCRVARMSCP
jgi:hypothetical protein